MPPLSVLTPGAIVFFLGSCATRSRSCSRLCAARRSSRACSSSALAAALRADAAAFLRWILVGVDEPEAEGEAWPEDEESAEKRLSEVGAGGGAPGGGVSYRSCLSPHLEPTFGLDRHALPSVVPRCRRIRLLGTFPGVVRPRSLAHGHTITALRVVVRSALRIGSRIPPVVGRLLGAARGRDNLHHPARPDRAVLGGDHAAR